MAVADGKILLKRADAASDYRLSFNLAEVQVLKVYEDAKSCTSKNSKQKKSPLSLSITYRMKLCTDGRFKLNIDFETEAELLHLHGEVLAA